MEWTFRPGQQVVVPNVVDMMRKMGTPGIGPSGQTFAGAFVRHGGGGGHERHSDRSPDQLARRRRQYGVFYNAVPYGEAFGDSAWVYGLQQNAENRSNLALVNTGEVDGSPSVFQLDIYDGAPSLDPIVTAGQNVSQHRHRPEGCGRRVVSNQQHPGRLRSGNHPRLCADHEDLRQQPLPGLRSDQRRRGSRAAQRDGAYLPARE